MADVLTTTLVLSEDVSPLPIASGWMFSHLDSPKDDGVILHGATRFRWQEGDLRRIHHVGKYSTSIGAIREVWSDEMKRTLALIDPLARRFVIAGKHFPRLYRDKITYVDRLPEHAPNSPRASRTNRFLDVLEQTVEDTGKEINPRGRETIDLEHWHRVISNHFVYAFSGAPRFALLVERPFVKVFAEWLRHKDLVRNRRRRMLKVPVEFPADPTQVPEFVAVVRRIAAGLSRLLEQDEAEFYRASTTVFQPVKRAVSGIVIPCDVLFVERPLRRDLVIPVIGLSLPQPREGYSLRLADGSAALVPSEPWRMGFSLADQALRSSENSPDA